MSKPRKGGRGKKKAEPFWEPPEDLQERIQAAGKKGPLGAFRATAVEVYGELLEGLAGPLRWLQEMQSITAKPKASAQMLPKTPTQAKLARKALRTRQTSPPPNTPHRVHKSREAVVVVSPLPSPIATEEDEADGPDAESMDETETGSSVIIAETPSVPSPVRRAPKRSASAPSKPGTPAMKMAKTASPTRSPPKTAIRRPRDVSKSPKSPVLATMTATPSARTKTPTRARTPKTPTTATTTTMSLRSRTPGRCGHSPLPLNLGALEGREKLAEAAARKDALLQERTEHIKRELEEKAARVRERAAEKEQQRQVKMANIAAKKATPVRTAFAGTPLRSPHPVKTKAAKGKAFKERRLRAEANRAAAEKKRKISPAQARAQAKESVQSQPPPADPHIPGRSPPKQRAAENIPPPSLLHPPSIPAPPKSSTPTTAATPTPTPSPSPPKKHLRRDTFDTGSKEAAPATAATTAAAKANPPPAPVPPTTAAARDSYEMTPPQRPLKPSTTENYNIDDLRSDDETDDDTAPKKRIPEWAAGRFLKAALVGQHKQPSIDPVNYFGPCYAPLLNLMFESYKQRQRFHKRGSSSHWESPLAPPPPRFYQPHNESIKEDDD